MQIGAHFVLATSLNGVAHGAALYEQLFAVFNVSIANSTHERKVKGRRYLRNKRVWNWKYWKINVNFVLQKLKRVALHISIDIKVAKKLSINI